MVAPVTKINRRFSAIAMTDAVSPADSATQNARSPAILLVEDDPGIREAMQMVLEDEGYRVVLAENGREALAVLRSGKRPDLIVLDLRMPVMDGWEFRTHQKADPKLAGIPLIAVSADGSAQAAAIDANAYLRKPLSAETLVAAIGRILAEAERKRLTERLEEAERFAALGRLAATVGHEINNPLAFLMINVDVVSRDIQEIAARSGTGKVSADRQELDHLGELLSDCRVGLERIRDVVGNLQSLSRPPQPRREPFSMNDVLDRALAIGRHKAEHRATIVRRYADLPPVVGDPSALGQVFLNLLLNAADALPIGHATDNQIVVTSRADGAGVVVEISDTGPGIPAHVLPHLFEPFFTTKPMGEGTGLGLSISWRIVTDHGGRIEAANNRDRGATFRVVLPVLPQYATAPIEGRAPPTIHAGARGRVLVIDDEPIIGRTIEAALAGEHEVVPVSLASEAFARLAEGEKFDVILCDVMMPDATGREVYERLLSDWPRAARGLVFMTGGACSPEASELVDRTSRRVLYKPFRVDELRAVVHAQMAEPGQSLKAATAS